MNRKLLLSAIVVLTWACKEKPAPPTGDEPLKTPGIHTVYTQTVCHGSACSYVHYMMLDTYDDEKFNDYDFVHLADGYLDTVKTALPVAAIQFCSPFSFHDIGGSEMMNN